MSERRHNVKSESRCTYFPVSPDDERWGVYVTTCGQSTVVPDSPYPPEQHPSGYHFTWANGRILQEFAIVYIPHGSGMFESRSGGKCRISEGSLFVLFPNEWHRYRPSKETGWTEYWVGFSGRYARSLANDFLSVNAPVVSAGWDEDLLASYLRILDLAQSEPVAFQQIMSGHALTILAHFYQNLKGRGTTVRDADIIIQKAKCAIIENLAIPLDLKALAQELNVGYSWLRRTFKHYTGLPLLQYQLQARIHRGQGLLVNTDLRVGEIADQCGFDSCYYFSRVFKNKTGVSPSAYRNRSRQRL